MVSERDVEVARMKIEGTPQREIGRLTGMSQQNVSRILGKKDIRAIVEEAQARIAQAATDAADNMVESALYYQDYITKVRRGEKPADVDKELVGFGFKASREIGKATGCLVGERTSVFIQNLYAQAIIQDRSALDRLLQAFTDRLKRDDDTE